MHAHKSAGPIAYLRPLDLFSGWDVVVTNDVTVLFGAATVYCRSLTVSTAQEPPRSMPHGPDGSYRKLIMLAYCDVKTSSHDVIEGELCFNLLGEHDSTDFYSVHRTVGEKGKRGEGKKNVHSLRRVSSTR